jgi:hypothetical protein
MQLEALGKLEEIHLIGSRTCNLLACSIVPQPTMLLHAPQTYINAQSMLIRMKYERIYSVSKKLERQANLETMLILRAI